MRRVNAILKGLYGAFKLARLDPDGLNYFDSSHEGFWNSFMAAIVILPLYLAIMLARWTIQPDSTNALQFLFVEIIAYIISWTAFPVLMKWVVQLVNREQYYIRVIISYNWAAVIQNIVYLPVVIMAVLGVGGITPLSFIIFILVVFYNFFVIRTALEVPIFAAWCIVMLDLIIAVLLGAWTDILIAN